MQKQTTVMTTPPDRGWPPRPTTVFSYHSHEMSKEQENIVIGDQRADASTGSRTC